MQQVSMNVENFLVEPTKDVKSNDTLDKEAFLNLLITQLKNQDPLQPMDDQEFIAQIAQFSTLESVQNVYSGVNQLKAIDLIGKSISANSSSGDDTISGIVQGIRVDKGNAYIIVNGIDIPIDNVITVAPSE
ncbi:flagellar hook capping FlgD N-terminal domain-containing protein [Calorimonas adulescens]|jgi:Flagellar hook capping protein.|nr:flagellar hook capping FlgD N-terminal domain-containing protein [Calorimonas adulescens]